MRLAILADIHGNAPALEAAIAHLRRDAPDLVVNLGDCLSGPLWPRETAEILMGLDWPTVRGNHDRYLTDLPRGDMAPSDSYAHDRLDQKHLDWLATLPPVIRRDGLMLFHARPDRDDGYLLDKVTESGEVVLASPSHIAARLRGERAPLMLCGHSHTPRVVQLEPGIVIVNPGSVGNPGYEDVSPVLHKVETGSPHARYALATRDGDSWRIELRAIEYDCNRAARQAADNDRPEWARALATGFLR